MQPFSNIKIGVFTTHSLIEPIKKALKSFPNFDPVFHTIDSSKRTLHSMHVLKHDVEVFLFTDYHAYNAVKNDLPANIPVHHVPLMGTGLYRSLSLLKSKYGLEYISLDTVENEYVEQILNERDEDASHLLPYETTSAQPEIQSVVNFHQQNYETYHACALTGIEAVATQLKDKHIPHEWVTPTQQDMIVALERSLLSTKTRRNKESQIVFGLINVDEFTKVTEQYTSEHDIQLLKLNIQQKLLDYIRQLDGHLINLGGEEYLFITTRGIFERKTRGYKFIPLLQEAKSDLQMTLSMGVGFGVTADEAGSHARLALRQSKELGGNVCYIVREDRSVVGPVDVSSQQQYEQYNLAITDPDVLERAKKAGMSASYMTMLMARVTRHGKIDYTAQELASTLKVTIRSAHRILLKWMDAELVDIVGEEKITHKGRPRRIYQLTFIDDSLLP